MKETIKSFNHLNIYIFLHALQVLHGKTSGSKMRVGWSSLRASGTKMRAVARLRHKNVRPCAPQCKKIPPKLRFSLKKQVFLFFF